MRKLIIIILLSIVPYGLTAQDEPKNVIDTLQVNIVFISNSGGLYVTPGIIVINGIKSSDNIGYDTIFSRDFYIYKRFNQKKLRHISESRVWDYKSYKNKKNEQSRRKN